MGCWQNWIDRAGHLRGRGRAAAAPARRRVLAFEECEPRLALATAAGAAIGAEGGLINLDFAAGDSVFVRNNGSLSQTIAHAAFDGDGLTMTGGQSFLNGAGGATSDIAWQLLNSGHVHNIDLGPAFDGSLQIVGPVRYLGAAVPSGESDVLRIDMPAQLDDSEGGSINLTAVLQPSGLLPLQRGAELAVAQSESQQTTPLGAAAEPATISPTESLRARAVVFRVAQTEAPSIADELLASLTERGDDEFAPTAGANPESPEVGRLAEASVTRPGLPTGDALPHDAAWLASAAGELDVAVSSDSRSDVGAVPASAPEAAVDAALAAWDDELAPPSTESDAGLVFTATRERSIVALAVAAVVGAAPVVRRFRRPGIHAPLEKAAGLQ
jgi:hypothetical protein